MPVKKKKKYIKDYKVIAKPESFLKKTPKSKDVTLAKTSKGKYFIYGGRGRSKYYDKISAIPKAVIEWVESTN